MFKSLFQRFSQVTGIALGLGMAFAAQAQSTDVTYLLPAPPNLPAFAPWIIAQQKGYYAAQNLNMTFIAAKGGVDVAKQIGAGNAMLGGALGDTPIVVRANGIPVRAVAVLGAGGVTMIATNAAENINSITDLKGKTMTVMSYSDTTYYALLASLRRAGLSKNDVNIQAAGPSGVWQLFSADKAQAMAGVPDWVVNAEEAGAKIKLIPQSQIFESMAQAILASDDAIEHHPEIVRGVVQATLQGMRDIIQDPKAAAVTFAKAVPAYAGKEASLEKIFRLYVEHVYANQAVLGRIDPARLEAVRQFYVSEGIVSHEPKLDELYTNQFIDTQTAAQ
ncbi:taurine ABC transporter substrate-binding protein [Pseudomonas sp. FW306-02-F02-AA]|uniref:Nitrate ABC transporter substrate-binding protein n=1 Tax=Pseudomonas fluorescens TaxID=294 RepID=A0A0N9WZX1_PSEFL|nr:MULTISPECIES: ABC transporter substrate-binding protein [Pseudomonas]ALI03832.1 nitrate ABC transporter substrate-binding protein [Pseudomonas fluorescens]PMZ02993.1 taurine ABC transporter substrate-binding protein [Pseudomonas sp. FW306-02-F02-AB]PMZ11920.1 taurine ABC transporter substrate-binding protein [Pseudomonas sp. FW306-02-H06C]PMZ14404.1 taurine ABC transporter substrate-binding protein [Pseudomonas sp. FW306-02-F02-AA]PMZ20445.1 taurine ABC transporter substrate-binding protein